MSSPRRLVLFVEGEGDRDAAPVLVKKLLTEQNAWTYYFLDKDPPFLVGDVAGLTKDDGRKWLRMLNAAKKKRNLGAVLLLLDGDSDSIRKEPFCAAKFAARLAQWSTSVGGGSLYSVACVFARLEFESWIIAGADRLAGQSLPDGRDGLPVGTTSPEGDLEKFPRDAKGWLAKRASGGYKESVDQVLFTQLLVDHLDVVRQRSIRSFRRLESAMQQLVAAACSGLHIASPSVEATGATRR